MYAIKHRKFKEPHERSTKEYYAKTHYGQNVKSKKYIDNFKINKRKTSHHEVISRFLCRSVDSEYIRSTQKKEKCLQKIIYLEKSFFRNK